MRGTYRFCNFLNFPRIGIPQLVGLFVEILTQVTLPIVAVMALGWFTQPVLKFDVGTLTRLQVYVILPCFLIHFLSTAALPLTAVWPTAWFTVLSFLILAALGWLAAAALRLDRSLWPIIGLAAAFPNSGNFGIPIAQLAFPPDYLLHQAVIVSLHTVLIAISVVWFIDGRNGGTLGSLMALLRSPLIPAVIVGLLLKGFEVQLPTVLSEPLKLMGLAYVPLALFVLGAQLSGSTAPVCTRTMTLMLSLKFLLAPGLSWLLLIAFGFTHELTQVLVIAAAAPVGLLLAIFCVEHRVHANTASAAVLVSTVLSPFVVTAWLLLVRLY